MRQAANLSGRQSVRLSICQAANSSGRPSFRLRLVRHLRPAVHLFFHTPHSAKLPGNKYQCQEGGHQISNRCRVHHALNAEEHGKDHYQGQKEDDLPGKRDEDTLCRLSDGRKVISRDRLEPV